MPDFYCDFCRISKLCTLQKLNAVLILFTLVLAKRQKSKGGSRRQIGASL